MLLSGNVVGVDLFNQSVTGGVSKALSSSATDADHIPCVLISYGIDHVVTSGGNCTAQGPCYYEERCPTMKAGGGIR